MRGFIVLCLVAAVCSDELGYNYQPVGHGSSSVPSVVALQSGLGSLGGSQGASHLGAASNIGASYAGPQGIGNLAASSNVGPRYGGSQGNLGQASHDNTAYTPQAELEKEFYTYTANEDDFQEPAASNQLSNSFKQGLRVIFIKGPENKGLENAALSLAKQASEQNTAIYVLTKQADLGNLANKLNTDNSNVNNKPEVHFVKYRTPEDAANAQKAIQQQYDSLGGTSQSHNGGVAPVLNFASQAPVVSHESAGSNGIGSLGGSLGAGSLGGSLGTGSLGGGSLGAGSLGGSLGAGSLGGSLGFGSLGGGSLGAGSSLGGSLSAGSLGGLSMVGQSYIPPSGSAGVSIPDSSYLPASIRRGLGQVSKDDAAYAPQVELNKEFITYTANEDDFNDPAASNQLNNSLKRSLRVVFIKGPENKGLEDAVLALATQAADQKTAIYVLKKQADLDNLADKLNAINKNNKNKPKVHFVKYRTPEDATNAQKAIQGQYDSLGGPSRSHDGGVAPVLNFASQAPAASHSDASSPSSSYISPASGSIASGPSASYLPASIFRRFRL